MNKLAKELINILEFMWFYNRNSTNEEKIKFRKGINKILKKSEEE